MVNIVRSFRIAITSYIFHGLGKAFFKLRKDKNGSRFQETDRRAGDGALSRFIRERFSKEADWLAIEFAVTGQD